MLQPRIVELGFVEECIFAGLGFVFRMCVSIPRRREFTMCLPRFAKYEAEMIVLSGNSLVFTKLALNSIRCRLVPYPRPTQVSLQAVELTKLKELGKIALSLRDQECS